MLELIHPLPVQVFAAVLYRLDAAWQHAVAGMERAWGTATDPGEPFPFDCTDYYEPEMGPDLRRRFIAFERLADPAALPRLKLDANAVEADLLADGARTVNIDVGYLDYNKIVLATTKEGPRRIYIGQDIWADMTLYYAKHEYHAFEWTFADFATGRYDEWLLHLREQYKQRLRDQGGRTQDHRDRVS